MHHPAICRIETHIQDLDFSVGRYTAVWSSLIIRASSRRRSSHLLFCQLRSASAKAGQSAIKPFTS